METMAQQQLLIDEHQACKFLNVSVSVLRRDRAKGHLKIPLIRIGGSVRYRFDDLRKWVDSQMGKPDAPANVKEDQEPSPSKRRPGRPTKASLKAQFQQQTEGQK